MYFRDGVIFVVVILKNGHFKVKKQDLFSQSTGIECHNLNKMFFVSHSAFEHIRVNIKKNE